MYAKRIILGLSVMAGAGLMTYAVINQPKKESVAEPEVTYEESGSDKVAQLEVKPLAADIGVEAKILAERQKEREARVLAQEEQMKALLAEQEKARNEALKKAQEETKTNLVVQTRPEVEELKRAEEKAKKLQEEAKAQEAKKAEETKKAEQAKQAQKPAQTKPETAVAKADKPADSQKPQEKTNTKTTRHTVQSGDSLIRLSKEYGIPVSALAAANNMGRNDALKRGTTLKIPSQSEIKALEAKAREEEKKLAEKKQQEQKIKDINERLANARREAKKQGINEGYSVQVALAADKAKADALAAKYKKAGYRVRTVDDARGVRVIIGPERSQEAANALRDKINNDPSVESRGAWVVK